MDEDKIKVAVSSALKKRSVEFWSNIAGFCGAMSIVILSVAVVWLVMLCFDPTLRLSLGKRLVESAKSNNTVEDKRDYLKATVDAYQQFGIQVQNDVQELSGSVRRLRDSSNTEWRKIIEAQEAARSAIEDINARVETLETKVVQ